MKIAIAGAGTMGIGIAQVAASAGNNVILYDINSDILSRAENGLIKTLDKLVSKGKMTESLAREILNSIRFTSDINLIENSELVIEAIIEKIEIKQNLFAQIEPLVSEETILASNTSSLAIAEIFSKLDFPQRGIGLHFFNPAPVLPLVEVVPSLLTAPDITKKAYDLMKVWGKVPVIAKDLPGFIVNRIARPFYGEALRIYEEGIADFREIDKVMKDNGFRMGPFELMDLIGNDVNYTVSETVFGEYYYDPRYKPSILQKRMKQAGLLGRKSGKGFYDYSEENKVIPEIETEKAAGIFLRIISMLINEAADALIYNVASKNDIELAMTKGVNYPKGLLAWADEIGIGKIFFELTRLQNYYGEDRYRPSPLIREYSENGMKFFD
ncbi:MAG: hypothetical protein SCALA702_19340 [Melioribacteraceae bacterium]|nr:MAG: hypothetical protein SCALA702_19340 [Melioribacteraceae bacterium]